MLDAILAQSRNTALIMGLIAMIGLLLQKKHATDVISGTMKTVIGFMVFNIGSSAMSGVVQTFTDLFNVAFGIEGVTTQVEVATGLALNTYGTEVALVMLLGFVVNLIVAKFTRFKAIFLTGQHFLYFACVIALIFIANGLPMPLTVIAGGILLGFCGAALPSFCQPFMNKITGADNLAMGHFNCIGYAFSGYVGKLFGKMGKSTEEKKDASTVNMPKFFELFRDFIFSVALFMVVLFYVAVIACVVNGHMDIVLEKAGNDIWFIYPFLQGLQFAAGMSVLIYGVRQFIAEITAAFVAISEKYIPNSKPAVDCPAIFPFAPTAVLIGFVGSIRRRSCGNGNHDCMQQQCHYDSGSRYLLLLRWYLRYLRKCLWRMEGRTGWFLHRWYGINRSAADSVSCIRRSGNFRSILPECRLQYYRSIPELDSGNLRLIHE